MPLEEYRRKRDFATTPEPSGDATAGKEGPARDDTAREAELPESQQPELPPRIFVIQKHAASRLHYDFRLELDGVLVSWAVPKGPSLDPHDKRLAVHVEDHPLDYATFEGTIPEGEYGAGSVIVWDRGTWEPLGDPPLDPHAGMAKGDFKFVLHGEKLTGAWVLVRMKPRGNERAENWLLIKERDAEARDATDYDLTRERPESVASGRTVEEVAEQGAAAADDAAARAHSTSRAKVAPASAVGADPIPIDAPMQLATLVDRPPAGEEWLHEVKYDGYRLRAAIGPGGRARLFTRSGQDWTDRLTPVAAAIAHLPAESALIDGELVAFDARGVSDFGLLQDAISGAKVERLAYVAFDLLFMDGHDLRQHPLVQRKEVLRALLAGQPAAGIVRFADHVRGGGVDFHEQACELNLEGSVSKLADRPWVPGRTTDWRKVKCAHSQEFVVGGFTEPRGSREGLGALLLGVYDEKGELRYSGRVGTGFTERTLAELRGRLDALATDAPPFATPPRLAGHDVRWVRPELVAHVAFREWTREGLVRHPSFRGLREDKPPREIVRETSIVADAGGAVARATSAATRRSSTRAGFGDPVAVGGITISNPGKRLFPDSDLTKLDLARYYERVARVMLPHVARRPLTLVRCPTGQGRGCFYQKHPDDPLSESLHAIELRERAGTGTYFYLEDAAGLLALAQMGATEIHTWGSRIDDSERPDRLVFDLDPGPGVEWSRVAETALLLRDRLATAGFTPFVKTTGGKGLHVVVPVEASLTYTEARAWTKSFVESLVARDPEHLTSKMAKHARSGRIFIDYVRNSHGATAVAPYSTRARAGAPVAVPVGWKELEGARGAALVPSAWSPEAVLERMVRRKWRDPWAKMDASQASSRILRAAASASS